MHSTPHTLECRQRRWSSDRRSRGMMFVEVLVTMGMFVVLLLAVTQLRIAKLQAQRHLEAGARRLEQAHNLLECALAAPWDSLRETPEDQLLAQWMNRLTPYPGLEEHDPSWRLEVNELEEPLRGLRIVVQHSSHSPDVPDRHPVRLVTWRYDIPTERESPPTPANSADLPEEPES
jgi:hypothetical protein